MTEDRTGPPNPGLTHAEAAMRVTQGRVNVDTSRRRTDGDVIRANALSYFNVVLAALILALLGAGEFRDGLFVGGVVAANVVIATLQELQATHRLRDLRALTAPTACVVREGDEVVIAATDVVEGDLVHLRPGDQVVADGPIVASEAEIDEALLTGESVPVRRGRGDQLRSGSFCTAGDAYYRAYAVGPNAYAVQLTTEARTRVRTLSPLMLRFRRLLRVLLIATGLLASVLFIQFNMLDRGFAESLKATVTTVTTVVPVGLLLAMTVVNTVGALRVSRSGAIVQDINAVEALNYVDVVALDKTGTITSNRLVVDELTWTSGDESMLPWIGAFVHAAAEDSRTAEALASALPATDGIDLGERVPFSSARRWSAAELRRGPERHVLVLGAPDVLLEGGESSLELRDAYAEAAHGGLRGVVFAEASVLPADDEAPRGLRPLVLVTLRDELRSEAREAFALMDQLEVSPKVISGDHPDTVAALLTQLGVEGPLEAVSGSELEHMSDDALDDAVERHTVFGRITPALKSRLVDALQRRGHFVAMVGDGSNDVPALMSADVAVAMASGTVTARAVADIVLLEDSFAALIRGTREATFVLGNTARLSKLFVAKSVYAFVLILATNMLGLEFPFLPRQGGVVSALTLGIPAIFIAIGVPPHRVRSDFTPDVLRFALPAGLALATVAMLAQFVTEGLLGRPIEEARTLVSLTIVVTGLAFVVEVLGLEAADWRRPWRPLGTLLLAGALLGVLAITMAVGPIRSFFAFTEAEAGAWVVVVAASAVALGGQYVLSRYWREIIDFLVAAPAPEDVARGRSL
ncbi:MAG: HAD-IC family P-type ATPase [Dehalococcoidia bacterium]